MNHLQAEFSYDGTDRYGNAARVHAALSEYGPWWTFKWISPEGDIMNEVSITTQEMVYCLRLTGLVVTK